MGLGVLGRVRGFFRGTQSQPQQRVAADLLNATYGQVPSANQAGPSSGLVHASSALRRFENPTGSVTLVSKGLKVYVDKEDPEKLTVESLVPDIRPKKFEMATAEFIRSKFVIGNKNLIMYIINHNIQIVALLKLIVPCARLLESMLVTMMRYAVIPTVGWASNKMFRTQFRQRLRQVNESLAVLGKGRYNIDSFEWLKFLINGHNWHIHIQTVENMRITSRQRQITWEAGYRHIQDTLDMVVNVLAALNVITIVYGELGHLMATRPLHVLISNRQTEHLKMEFARVSALFFAMLPGAYVFVRLPIEAAIKSSKAVMEKFAPRRPNDEQAMVDYNQMRSSASLLFSFDKLDMLSIVLLFPFQYVQKMFTPEDIRRIIFGQLDDLHIHMRHAQSIFRDASLNAIRTHLFNTNAMEHAGMTNQNIRNHVSGIMEGFEQIFPESVLRVRRETQKQIDQLFDAMYSGIGDLKKQITVSVFTVPLVYISYKLFQMDVTRRFAREQLRAVGNAPPRLRAFRRHTAEEQGAIETIARGRNLEFRSVRNNGHQARNNNINNIAGSMLTLR